MPNALARPEPVSSPDILSLARTALRAAVHASSDRESMDILSAALTDIACHAAPAAPAAASARKPAPLLRLVDQVPPLACRASLDLLQQERQRVLQGDVEGVMVVTMDADGSYSCNSADALYQNDRALMTVTRWLMGTVVGKGMYPEADA